LKRLPHISPRAKNAGLASLEAVLIFAFVFLPFIVVTFQSVKLGYVSMDRLIAARNAAWKKEIYFDADDSSRSLVNVAAITAQGVLGDTSGFLKNDVRSVHSRNVIAYSKSQSGAMQKSVFKEVRAKLGTGDTNKGNIKLNDMTRIVEDFDFKGVQGTSLSPGVKLIGLSGRPKELGIADLALLGGGLLDGLIALRGLKQSHHFTDFQAGWTLPTNEDSSSLRAHYKDGLVYHPGYDKKLSAVVGKKKLFRNSIPSQ
jgi:hypothetical protein